MCKQIQRKQWQIIQKEKEKNWLNIVTKYYIEYKEEDGHKDSKFEAYMKQYCKKTISLISRNKQLG